MKNLTEKITKDSRLLSAIKSHFPEFLAKEMEEELNLMIERANLLGWHENKIDGGDHIKLAHRERQALFMLEKGMKNREMAKQLNNNEKSVSTYVARIKKKLNISNDCNTYQLIKVALMLGLIPTTMPQDKPKKAKNRV